MSGVSRYSWAAPAYDVLSLEWPVYRAGRVAGVQALALRSGDRVVDLGCGSGLSFALLREAVGPSGHVIGVDANGPMLFQAGQRIARHGWTNIDLVQSDATTLGPGALGHRSDHGAGPGDGAVDAILFAYSLSLMHPWQEAWAMAMSVVRQGGRIAVVDMGLPRGMASACAPLARLACALGGADIGARPWAAAERDLAEVTSRSLRGGHIEVRAGTLPASLGAPRP